MSKNIQYRNKMINKLLIVIMIFLPLMIFPQGIYQVDIRQNRPVGKNLRTDEIIVATEYIFPDHIKSFFVDSAFGIVTMKLQKIDPKKSWENPAGYLMLYDMNKNLLKGTRKINYLTDSLIQCNSGFIHSMPDKSTYRSFKGNGNSYSTKNNMVFVSQESDLGLGYRSLAMNQMNNTIQGIKLTDGKVLWEKELTRAFGWNDAFFLNDTVLIIVASGLHTIDVHNGKGWSYFTKTGIPDYKKQLTDLILKSSYYYFSGLILAPMDQYVTSGMVSNVVIEGNDIYFASVGRVVRLDKRTGKVIWYYKFPDELSGKSKLFKQDGKLIMINSGIAESSSGPVLYGKPFIAAIEPETGAGIYMYYPEDGTNQLIDYRIRGENMIVLSNQMIFEYSWKVGKVIHAKNINPDKYNGMTCFHDSELFVSSKDSSGGFIHVEGTTQLLVQTDKNQILVFNQNLQVINCLEAADVYRRFEYERGICFITNGKEIVILDSSYNTLAEIRLSVNYILSDHKLYATEGQSLYVVDLTNAIGIE